ncbi:MAG: gliding motility-associated C-terminal domain-containing protein [Flavobacteriales bacterium]|nr:gliding motility-associated C-terminal domain-containing protein [Flavobacteriales bacterium]
MKRLTVILLILLVPVALTKAGNTGIRFTPNLGQWEEPFLFKANLGNGALFVEKHNFTYNFYNSNEYHFHNFKLADHAEKLRFHAFKVHFRNANPNPAIENKDAFSDYTNFYLGKDPNRWKSFVRSYQTVFYQNLYPFIDLALYSLGDQLKYDVIVNPGGNPKSVQLEYEGLDELYIDAEGNLHIKTSVNEIIEQKPYAYQTIDGQKVEVPCKFVLNGSTLSFKLLKSYKKNLPLVIDPVLVFASYSGSFADNFGMTATYGYDGSLFAGGTAFNVGYPTTVGAFDTSFNGSPASGITDVVITRYDSTGSNLTYSTYIGGAQAETVHSLIANESNELFLYGVTSSLDFPVTSNAYDTTFNGGVFSNFPNNGTTFNNGTDIYVAKFNANGTVLMGCTYIGGSNNDGINHKFTLTGNAALDYDSLMNNYGDQYRGEIMLDRDGDCYIASSTKSNDFPAVNGFDNTLDGHQDAVVFKFSSDLSNLIWSNYLGGSSADAGFSLKVDTNKNVYVCGGTGSADFPFTPGVINTNHQGGKADGYITKIDSSGSSILASTFIGTNNYDQCYFVEIDRFGSIYAVGQTKGVFPIINAVYSNPGSGQFIMRMNNNLTTIDYSTLFGNGNINTQFSPSAFLVDRCENVYVSGWGGNILNGTAMTNMPTTANAPQPNSGDGFNFYLFVLERNAQSQLFGTYFGGNQSSEHVDGGTSRFDKNGIVYQSVCAGCWNNDDFPTTPGAWSQVNNSTGCNNGIFKFDFEIIPKAQFSVDNFQGCAPLTVTFTNSSGSSDSYLWDFGGGDTTSQIFNPVKTYTNPGTYNVTLLITDSICNTVDTAFQTIVVAPPITVFGGDTIGTCDTTTLSVNTTGNPSFFIWSSNNQFTDTLNSSLTDSSLFVTVGDTTWFYVMASNGPCSAIDSFRVDWLGFDIQANDAAICSGEQVQITTSTNSPTSLTYSWTPSASIVSGGTTGTPTVNPAVTTTYTVTAQNANGCFASDTAQVIVSGFNANNINLWADNDSIYGSGGTYLHVTPGSGFTYVWVPPFNLDNPTSPNPYFTPTFPSTTTFTLTMTEDGSGCSYSRTITIYAFDVVCGEPDIFIPNAFTPNNDNENDVLYVRGRNVGDMVLKIYNRWGELVFETQQQRNGWDGTFKGELVDPGVFVYYLTVTCVDGQEYFKKGNITVIR